MVHGARDFKNVEHGSEDAADVVGRKAESRTFTRLISVRALRPMYAPRHPYADIIRAINCGSSAPPMPVPVIVMPSARPRFSSNQPETAFA